MKGGRKIDREHIERMSNIMQHRGPDDSGVYLSTRVGLGHRRLSIIDLHTGKQPLSNERGTIWVVFNGEIYNYRELRDDLLKKGHLFKTQTDTEVIVHLYEEYDVAFVAKLQGMFAIALWDEEGQTLVLARDRVGIKPLYYSVADGNLLFASEMKAILTDTSVSRSISFGAIDLLLRYHYMPGETTLFKGIKKLLPGHYLLYRNSVIKDVEYWDLRFPAVKIKKDEATVKNELIELLRKAVCDHMISDVPVGFLLSGGLDSTALLSFAVEQTDKAISTFTIGFDSESFADERKYARIAANRFGTTHYDMTIGPHDFVQFLPQYVWYMEEPICEPPAVALYHVTKLASSHVKVLLSGEGGDEAFAGYPNYRNLVWMERIKKVLGPLSSTTGALLLGANELLHSDRFGKYAQLMGVNFADYYYSRTSTPFAFMCSHAQELFSADFLCVLEQEKKEEYRESLFTRIKDLELLDKMLYIDTKTWLPDDLLVKADKMTMANSVELRVPLLDHSVLEYASALPAHFKLHGMTTKYILKEAFTGRVPEEIIRRKKTGFPVPYDKWMSNELKEYMSAILLDDRTMKRGYFQRDAIRRMLDANGRSATYSKEIFLLVVLELWHRCFIDSPSQLNGLSGIN
jgi:asparagine synthase (glutamine-hydrolysing)